MKPQMISTNFVRADLKRKKFSKGKSNFKRYKKTPKFIRDNPENQIAKQKEKDVFTFTDDEDDGDELGMGIELSDLPFLMNETLQADPKQLIALGQDTVSPLFNKDNIDNTKIHDALSELNYSSFRSNQKEAITRILQGRSTLFVSPTGSGKSLCYQLPALLYWRHRQYMTIVVSPLISLMEDQLNNFPSVLKAVSLHSGQNMIQRRRVIEQLVNHQAQVVFISPEAIVGGLLHLDDLKNLPPVGFVCIDEAHCLSECSHNFRPAYMQFVNILHEQLKIKTFLGLTATASRATKFEICRHLIINPEYDVIGETTIPENLILSASYESNKESALIKLLKSPTFRIMPSIIVYCNRRDDTEKVASLIRTGMQSYSTLVEVPERKKRTGAADENLALYEDDTSPSGKPHMKLTWNAEAYHAGLSMETRKRIQRSFIKGETRVVVATIAFGMGINKSNVRAIIHYDMPSSFEGYVQEIGRAGRDGKPAQCHMFLNPRRTDLYYQQRNIYSSITDKKGVEKLVEYLFHPCVCLKTIDYDPSENDKLDKLNQLDPHEISSSYRTKFTPLCDNNTETGSGSNQCAGSDNEDDDDDDDILGLYGNNENVYTQKPAQTLKYKRKSVIRKHRRCREGHEISIPIDKVVEEINLKAESIVTLFCQIQKTYPQLQLKQYSPAKTTCHLLCYKGVSQMEALIKSSRHVKTAWVVYMRNYKKLHGEMPAIPDRLVFDITEVAKILSQSIQDVIRALKSTEWECVQKSGTFRKSQVRVKFDGYSFHLKVVGDLKVDEIREMEEFLYNYMNVYEITERSKVEKFYETLRDHCIELDNITDKDARLQVSANLRNSLNSYFQSNPDTSSIEGSQLATVNSNERISNESEDPSRIPDTELEYIKKDIRAFISSHSSTSWTALNIARIFQGVSSPNYPAEHWGPNRKWWRIHPDVDFLKLRSLIAQLLVTK